MDLIERTDLLKKIVSYKDTNGIIKVITGIRRCGKSTMFKLYEKYLLANNVKQEQIIKINLDNIENKVFFDNEILYSHIKSRLLPGVMNYVFLDEIQNVNKFQLILNALNEKDNVDLYITGSNAYLLSGELATLLSGRYVQLKIYPLSFKEYYSSFSENEQKNKINIFNNYIIYGGFPYSIKFKNNDEMILNYLEGLYNTIIIKDVMNRNKTISDSNRLEKIMLFLVDNIGSLTSVNNIKNKITNDGFKIYTNTIVSYINSLLDSFLIYEASRYNIKGKELLVTNSKYYVADLGLRYYLLRNGPNEDRGHILENIVYLELLRRDYKVYTGKYDNLEIDFVAIKSDKKLYIQVCETLLGEQTREREFRPLKIIDDNYEKIVITEDSVPASNIAGIEYMNIIDWLLQ